MSSAKTRIRTRCSSMRPHRSGREAATRSHESNYPRYWDHGCPERVLQLQPVQARADDPGTSALAPESARLKFSRRALRGNWPARVTPALFDQPGNPFRQNLLRLARDPPHDVAGGQHILDQPGILTVGERRVVDIAGLA